MRVPPISVHTLGHGCNMLFPWKPCVTLDLLHNLGSRLFIAPSEDPLTLNLTAI